jgi:hypothetical protein
MSPQMQQIRRTKGETLSLLTGTNLREERKTLTRFANLNAYLDSIFLNWSGSKRCPIKSSVVR